MNWKFVKISTITVSFIIGIFATKLLMSFGSGSEMPSVQDGFNFQPLLEDGRIGRGPLISSKIDLARLVDRDNIPLERSIGEGPVMLVPIVPECGMCFLANDQMRIVKQGIEAVGVTYCLVLITPSNHASEFFDYADLFQLENSKAFKWNFINGPPREELLTITTPSHILASNRGIVIQKWPGSSPTGDTRIRMANQIIADTIKLVQQ